MLRLMSEGERCEVGGWEWEAPSNAEPAIAMGHGFLLKELMVTDFF